MRILINATGGTHGVSGVARYVRNLVRWLPVVADSEEVTAFEFRWRKQPFADRIGATTPLRTVFWPMPPRVGEALFQRLPALGVGGPLRAFDLVHLPCPLPVECRARYRVVTVHQAPLMQRPELFPVTVVETFHHWLAATVKRAALLIAVSDNMRETLIDRFKVPAERVTAIPPGIDPQFSPGTPEGSLPCGGRPYLLYVGRINLAKNVAAVCRAFRVLASRYPELQLVLVGPLDVPRETVSEWLGRPSLDDRVQLTGVLPADSQELVDLYRSAQVFVYPSLTDGWTMVPIEAMACGTPVVTSNTSSLPEQVGDAALLVDPLDPEALAATTERLLVDTSLRRLLVERGLQHAAQFTGKRMACETLRAYRTVLA
jgi:glycosyltransferase involved in cell wall biosynthesis